MRRKIKFTLTADRQYTAIEEAPAKAAVFEQVRKAIGYLEIDPHHPSLQTHEFTSLSGANGETKGKKRIPVVTVVAITSHP